MSVINRVKLADAVRYVEYQIKDTEYFMIEPISFLKEAIKERKVIPLFHFDGHATITEAYKTKFKDIRQTMRLSGYFTAPYSLQEYEGILTNYGFELDKTDITISQAIVYDLDFIDVIQFTAPFQRGKFVEPNFHDHIQIKRNDLVSLYVHKPFLDDMEMYYASDSNPRTIYDKIEVKTEDLHFELSHLKALFSSKGDKIPAPTVTQTQPPDNDQLIKELAAAKAEITKLENQLAKAKTEQTDTPADDNILQTILDESHDEHAPDLKHAVKLWIDLYINKGVGGGSHSAMANNWIYGNTGYENSTDSSPVKRLREITTPLKDFGGQRPKEVKK